MYHIKKFKLYYLLGIVFFLASFRGESASEEALTYSVPSYIAFVQKMSNYIIVFAMIVSLLLNDKKFRYQTYYKDSVNYFVFFIILILSGENDLEELIYRIIFSIITLLYFVKVVSRFNLKYLFLFVSLAIFAFSLVNFFSFFLFPETIWNGRLFGVTNHPNFTGIAATVSSVFSFYFLIYSRWKIKLFYLVTLCIGISVCIFSGSRNSIFSLIFSFIVFLFIKFKGFAPKIFLIFGSLLLMLLFLNIDLSFSTLDYEGRGNTREETWRLMFDVAAELPVFGSGKTGATSNSYLFAIVASGLIGFLFFINSILGFIKRIVSQDLRKHTYFPLLVMLSASLFFSAIFEGFLLDQISLPVFTYWLILVINLKEYNRFKNNNKVLLKNSIN